jgi:tetratricopeptide (TPR) repeat protein
MRYFALLAATIWICGCGSHPAKAPESSADHKALEGAVVDADAHTEQPDSDQATLRQVKKLTAEGQLAAAVELCGNFIGTHPKSAQALRLRAQANALRHNDADAVADFSTAIALEPQDASHCVARGFFQLTRGNTSKSIDDFTAAIKLDPKNAQAFNDRGMARVTTGELKQAVDDFNRAIELDPKYVSAYTNRSFALVKLDRRRDAMADLDHALELDPKAAGAYDSRGALRLEDHDYPKALADFTSAIKLERNNPTYYTHRRETYLKLERYPEAQADGTRIERLMQLNALNEAVFRNRLSPRPYLDRGDFLLEEGKIDDAIANFDHALELDAKQVRGLIGRARAWVRRGEFQKAVTDSTAALAIEPRDEAYAVRGDAYRKLSQFAKAVADYDAAQRIDAEVAETWLLYSRELRQSNHVKESDEALKRANELKSLDAPRISRVASTAASVVK